MNVKNTDNISFIFLSFLKRLLVVSLAIIISFNTVCKPKETQAVIPLFAGILAVAGAVCTVTGAVIGTKTIIDWFSENKEMDESEVVNYFNQNVSVDGDGNYIFSDDAKLIINDMLADYDESVTMTYRYPLRPEKAQADVFPSSTTYQMFVDAVQSHPDYFFVLNNHTSENVRFYVIKDIQSVVNSNNDLIYANCNLYNSDWTNEFYGYSVTLDFNSSKWLVNKNISGYGNKAVSDFDLIFDDPDDSRDWSQTLSVSSGVLMRSDNVEYPLFQAKWVISSHNGALNCYKSEADMKKDIGSQFVGRYTDSYTGTPNYSITQSDVDNVVNNYYGGYPPDDSGGSGSGSDDSGGSSSGGSGIIDGLGKLFGAIGNIIDKLFGFVLGLLSKVVDFFASILEMFTDTLTKLIDVIPSGFNEFLAAMFPYIPEEWITIAEFILLVSAIGCVVALFKR